MRQFIEGPARQNAFGSLVIQGSLRLARLTVIVAGAAVLSPPAFASLAVALALTDLVRGAVQAFDIDAVRQLARGDDARQVVRAGLSAKALVCLAGLILAGVAAWLLENAATAALVAILGLGVVTGSAGATFLVERQAALALHSVSARVAMASALGAGVAVLAGWLSGSAALLALALTLGDVLLLVLTGRAGVWRFSGELARAQVAGSAPLLLIQLAHFAQFRVGTIVLAALGSTVAVGEYTIASRLTEGLIVLAMALSSSSLPMMGAAHAQNERADLNRVFERSYGLGTKLVAPLVAGLVLAVPIWVGLLFPRYPAAGPPAAVVGLAIAIFFGSSQTTALLNATHRDRTASGSALAGLTMTVLASMLLGPFGAIGVAWARVAGELTRFTVEAIAAVRDHGVRLVALAAPWLAVSPVLIGAGLAVASGWRGPVFWLALAIVVLGTLPLLPAVRQVAKRLP